MSATVRKGIGKNVYIEAWKDRFQGLKINAKTGDGAGIAAGECFIACGWEAGGGGTIGVVDLDQCGVRQPQVTFFRGHKGLVHDIQLSPFYPSIFATASEDGTVKLWDCPQRRPDIALRDSVVTLHACEKKVSAIAFNHVAEWIIASVGADNALKVWNMETQQCVNSFPLKSSSICIRWNWLSDLIALTDKDRSLKIVDGRTPEIVADVEKIHAGAKPVRANWLWDTASGWGDPQYLCSTGFAKTAEREVAIWDLRHLEKPVTRSEIDRQSGSLLIDYDYGTGLLTLLGRGDGSIRFFESVGGSLSSLYSASLPEPARDLAFMPKRGVNVMKCEVGRIYLVGSPSGVTPISIFVPRRDMTQFQHDLFPDCLNGVPAMTAEEWEEGSKAVPCVGSMKPVDGKNPFDVLRRPRGGGIIFDRDRSAVRNAPSVLQRQMTRAGQVWDDEKEEILREVETLKETIARQADQINQLEADKAEGATRVEQLDAALRAYEILRTKELKKKDSESTNHRATLQEQNALIKKLEASLKERDSQVKGLELNLLDREMRISDLESRLEEASAVKVRTKKDFGGEIKTDEASNKASKHRKLKIHFANVSEASSQLSSTDIEYSSPATQSTRSPASPKASESVQILLQRMEYLEERNDRLETVLRAIRMAANARLGAS